MEEKLAEQRMEMAAPLLSVAPPPVAVAAPLPSAVAPVVPQPRAVDTTDTAVEDVGPYMVPVSMRLPQTLYQRLSRVSGRRKARRTYPWTAQDITAEALNAWLQKNG